MPWRTLRRVSDLNSRKFVLMKLVILDRGKMSGERSRIVFGVNMETKSPFSWIILSLCKKTLRLVAPGYEWPYFISNWCPSNPISQHTVFLDRINQSLWSPSKVGKTMIKCEEKISSRPMRTKRNMAVRFRNPFVCSLSSQGLLDFTLYFTVWPLSSCQNEHYCKHTICLASSTRVPFFGSKT